MVLDVFTICEYAQISHEKLNIFGISDTFFVPTLPTKEQFYLAGKISFDSSEIGKHVLKIEFFCPNGETLFEPWEINIDVEFINIKLPFYNFYKLFSGIQFSLYGNYLVTVFIDNKPLKTIPLYISPII